MAQIPVKITATALRFGLAVAALACTGPALGLTGSFPVVASAVAAIPVLQPLPGRPMQANFAGQLASTDARRVANWAVASRDNADLPFVVIDKAQAKVFVFDHTGLLQGATLALLGMARGDDSVPGIGNRKLGSMRPDERTTPAGRFMASLGNDLETDILWVDYGAAISLHRVIRGAPGDHRLQRLATPSPLDKRITYGCINVPVGFYDNVVRKTFAGTVGVVYILPEVKAINDVFPIDDGPAPGR